MRFAPGGTLFLALVLAVLPLPETVSPFRPDWVALTLIFWSLAAPPAFGLLTAFAAGLALDALSGALLGQHALGLLVLVYLCRRFRLQLRAFPASQLTLVVAALLALYEFSLFWIDGASGRTVPIGERWPAVISGTLVWVVAWSTLDHGRESAPARL